MPTLPRRAKIVQRLIGDCLVEKGYAPFALSRDQTKQLYKYDKGSPARLHYLHQISSDPKILNE